MTYFLDTIVFFLELGHVNTYVAISPNCLGSQTILKVWNFASIMSSFREGRDRKQNIKPQD